MASTKANHFLTNFSYTDINGHDSLADVIIAENLDIVLISPINRSNVYSVEEFNSVVKIANIVLKDFKVTASKAMFFVRTNQFSFKFIEDFIEHNLGEERVFLMIFNNLGTAEDTFIEFSELTVKEIAELYSLLKSEGASYYDPVQRKGSSLLQDLKYYDNDHFVFQTEDHLDCRKLRNELSPAYSLPESYYQIYTLCKREKIVPKIKSSQGINITLKYYYDTSLFLIGFLTAVQALQIMKKINKVSPLVINDPLVYHWLKNRKCTSKEVISDVEVKKKIKMAEKWISQQTYLPEILLYYY